jgi:hypothetical protein
MNHSRLVSAATAAFFCALLLQPAEAQTLYKSTMPDGRILYGDKPAPGAAKVEEIQPDTGKGGLGGTTPRQQDTLQDMERARLQREAGEDMVQKAAQALKDAEAARETGKEPLESERIGTSGGASRLTDSYFERQRRLEQTIERARRELDEARSGK